MSINNIIAYFNDCYQSDNRDLSIDNFFSPKVEKRIMMSGREELVDGYYPQLPVNHVKAEEIVKDLALYYKEKELLYCTVFIIGKKKGGRGKNKTVCSPLFFFPAEIIQEEGNFFVKIEIEKRRINYSLLKTIRDEEEVSGLYENLHKELPTNEIDFKEIGLIKRVLEKYFPELNTNQILLYPNLFDEDKIKELISDEKIEQLSHYYIIPASGLGLVTKSENTLGILNELSEISRSPEFSEPLRLLFGEHQIINEPQQVAIGRVPTILSLAQQKMILAASTYPFNLIVGPPGTGKSYTISALAIEHLSKGKSVLIASRTDQAVDVIANKIENQLEIKDVIVRGGRSTYLRDLQKHLKNLLSGINTYSNLDYKALSKLNSDLSKLEIRLKKLEKHFEKRVIQENKRGEYIAGNEFTSNFFKKIKKSIILFTNKLQTPHWELIAEIENELEKLITLTVAQVRGNYGAKINETLKKHRKELTNFDQAVRVKTGSIKEEYFDKTNFEVILSTFPVWLVKITDIYRILPLKKELFDLAIIDEATQCDIASIIPIMQRAKKVVIAGDPNQLRHVSFLSRERQMIMQKAHNLENMPTEMLNFRDKSILDLVSDKIANQNQVTFLNEHYRSLPDIIRFSNAKFYSNAISIMTEKPDIPANEGIYLEKTDGVRTEQGYNVEEADKILTAVKQIIENQANLDKKYCNSLGIISPLRAQTDYIISRINKELTIDQIQRHELLIGTAYAFQGEERDFIFLSFAIDDASHAAAFHHLDKPDVFNVAITRARTKQFIFYSVSPSKLKPESLLRQYIESFDKNSNSKQKQNTEKDKFLKEVSDAFAQKGYKTWEAYKIAGQIIDLIVQKDEKSIAIDLIGYPGKFVDAFSIERYKMLRRAGIVSIALPYTYWFADKEKTLQAVESLMFK